MLTFSKSSFWQLLVSSLNSLACFVSALRSLYVFIIILLNPFLEIHIDITVTDSYYNKIVNFWRIHFALTFLFLSIDLAERKVF